MSDELGSIVPTSSAVDEDASCAVPLTEAQARQAIAGDLAVFVVTRTADGRDRRRAYLGLGAAQRAVERAYDRGAEARVVLVRLEPVAVGGEC